MSSAKFRPPSIPKSIEAFAERHIPTSEELECERRGYKLTRTILGKGAYAKVMLASATALKLEKDKSLMEELKRKGDSKVAIKIISKKTAPVEYLNKFMPREIDALNSISGCHNVVKLYEAFRSENRIYLVMEYANKGDLLEFINSGRSNLPGIGEPKAKRFFKQLVEGLDYCHRRNIVHRDMKCENILIHDKDIIKISDFGFATRFPTTRQPLLETFCGSYAYAAPEILQAEKYDGKAADIWSLGIILFAMLNGRLPFNDRDIPTLVEQTKGKLRFSTKVQLSADCKDLVKRILTPNHRKRIPLSEILRHSWLQRETSESDLLLTTARGVPDGKSEKFIASDEKAAEPKNLLSIYHRETKDLLTGAKLETSTKGAILDKWADKNSKCSVMALLLRDQALESSQPHSLKEKRHNFTKKGDIRCDTQLCDISNMTWCTVSQKTPVSQPNQKQKAEQLKDEKSSVGKTQTLEYRYQALAKEKSRGNNNARGKNAIEDQSKRGEAAKKAPVTTTWTEVKIPVSNMKTAGHRQIYYPGLKLKDNESPDLNLPPVYNEQSRASTSLSKKPATLEESKRKRTVEKQLIKEGQLEAKCVNFTNVRVNLRGNWPKHTSKRVRNSKKNALRYYNLNGEEVAQRKFDNSGKTSVTLDVNGKKAYLGQ
ncbi:uncharacterized protein LOC135683751 [Rhopilema esculentum]|uniref:uncharacterized protein LOC135683751 n=1 Tax=Rhopilema esculentum TaxID=499914 RepID=UPI0031CF0C3F